MAALGKGEDPVARSIGIHPAASVKGKFDMFNEIGFHAPYREWARLVQAGVAGGKAYPITRALKAGGPRRASSSSIAKRFNSTSPAGTTGSRPSTRSSNY